MFAKIRALHNVGRPTPQATPAEAEANKASERGLARLANMFGTREAGTTSLMGDGSTVELTTLSLPNRDHLAPGWPASDGTASSG